VIIEDGDSSDPFSLLLNEDFERIVYFTPVTLPHGISCTSSTSGPSQQLSGATFMNHEASSTNNSITVSLVSPAIELVQVNACDIVLDLESNEETIKVFNIISKPCWDYLNFRSLVRINEVSI
jgi:hypothetical protein|tara:strand:- start:461 stop:829 length:369 start_codon:yes stop_codon:yes gene_type:complete